MLCAFCNECAGRVFVLNRFDFANTAALHASQVAKQNLGKTVIADAVGRVPDCDTSDRR